MLIKIFNLVLLYSLLKKVFYIYEDYNSLKVFFIDDKTYVFRINIKYISLISFRYTVLCSLKVKKYL